MRPMLTLAAARLCGYEGERHMGLAACVEFIHTATLLHDDVVDESDLRRGQPSANAIWDNKACVLVGDFLFSRSFELMVADGSLDVLAILSNASAVIAEGEVHQLMTANDTETGETAYLEVLLGKAIGDDFREGKITLPVILAFRRGNDKERTFWRRTLEDLDQHEGDFEHAMELLDKHKALEDTLERARHYGSIARDALGIFGDSPEKAALIEAIDFCIDRAY